MQSEYEADRHRHEQRSDANLFDGTRTPNPAHIAPSPPNPYYSPFVNSSFYPNPSHMMSGFPASQQFPDMRAHAGNTGYYPRYDYSLFEFGAFSANARMTSPYDHSTRYHPSSHMSSASSSLHSHPNHFDPSHFDSTFGRPRFPNPASQTFPEVTSPASHLSAVTSHAVSKAGGGTKATVKRSHSTSSDLGDVKTDQASPGEVDDEQKPAKKRTNSIPDECKDKQYWERRRKNNESARRSRESRRTKEEMLVYKCQRLNHENHRLKEEAKRLREENIKTRFMLLQSH